MHIHPVRNSMPGDNVFGRAFQVATARPPGEWRVPAMLAGSAQRAWGLNRAHRMSTDATL